MISIKIAGRLAIFTGAIALGACASYGSGGTIPSDKPGFSHDIFNVEKVTCWELSTIPEEDAAYAATLMYGYSQGMKGEATQTPSKIESSLSHIAQKCAGNPDMLIMDAFN